MTSNSHQISIDENMIRVHFVGVELVEEGLVDVGQGVGHHVQRVPLLDHVRGRKCTRLRPTRYETGKFPKIWILHYWKLNCHSLNITNKKYHNHPNCILKVFNNHGLYKFEFHHFLFATKKPSWKMSTQALKYFRILTLFLTSSIFFSDMNSP